MRKKRYRSILTREQYLGQSFEGVESMVEPDQSLSIKEMIERFGRGLPVNVKVYDDYSEEPPICEPGDDYFSVFNRFKDSQAERSFKSEVPDVLDSPIEKLNNDSEPPIGLSSESDKPN